MEVGSIVVNGTVRQVSTDYLIVASGSTAQRPSIPSNGMVRYNTDLFAFELYTGGGWFQLNTTIVRDRAPLDTDSQIPVGTIWIWSNRVYVCASNDGVLASWIELNPSNMAAHPGLALDRYYSSDFGTLNTIQCKAGSVFAIPILLSEGMNFNRVGVDVTKSKSGSTVNIGLYHNNGGYPGELACDFGFLSSDTNGAKEIALNYKVSTTQFFWLAVAVSDTITLRATESKTGSTIMGRTSPNGNGVTYVSAPMEYGSMLTVFPSITPETGNAPFIWIRRV